MAGQTTEELQADLDKIKAELAYFQKQSYEAGRASGEYGKMLKGITGGVLPGLTKGLTSLGAAAISGDERITTYANAIGDLSKEVPIFGSLLSKGGGLVAQFIDDTAGSFKDLAQSGFQFEGGMSVVAQAASEAGLSVKDFGRFAKDNSSMLRTLAGESGQAAVRFARMSAEFSQDSRNFSQGLRQIGFSTDEINESLIGFAAINRTTYLQNLKAGTSQNKAAFKFATELDRMSQLTGENRKQLMKEMDAKRRDGRVQAFLRTQTGEMGDAITKTSAMLGSMDKGAQALVEDILIQGSATKESAAAAAFYGKGVTDAAQEMRAAQQAGDTEAYAAAQKKLIIEIAKAQNDQEKIRVATYRTSGGYIQGLQGMVGNFTDTNDRIKAEQAEMENIHKRKVSIEEATASLLEKGLIRQKQAGVDGKDGKTTAAQDTMTATYAAATDAISNTSRVLKTEMVTSVRTAANSLGKDLPDAINETALKLRDGVKDHSTKIRDALLSEDTNFTAGSSIIGKSRASAHAKLGATAQAGFEQERTTTGLNQKLIDVISQLNITLTKLNANINKDGNFMGGTAFGDMLNLVGEKGPEFITPNANSLVVTAKQMADKMRPQMESMASQMQPEMESIAENMKANAPKIASSMNRASKEVDFEMLFNGQNQQMAQTNKLLEQVVRAIKKNGGDLQLV